MTRREGPVACSETLLKQFKGHGFEPQGTHSDKKTCSFG